ncbi:MAG TPA: RNA polymerase sigma factor [Ktedonobacteraceae bacterium]|nr:RNA polymerase sigma factor [Ktedonobacteraceae bacterium]
MFRSQKGTSASSTSQSADEISLVKRAQAKDEQAFDVLYERYFVKIHLYLTMMVGNGEIARELTQEVFLKVWYALPALRKPETFSTWLYRIATNIARDLHRHEKNIRCESYDHDAGFLNMPHIEGPEEIVEAKDSLEKALLRLNWKYRACFILYYIQGMPKHKIAEMVDLKESSVPTYLSNALEELRVARHRLQSQYEDVKERKEKL